MNQFHFLFDIDGTLTEYKQGALSHLLCGNFLFPVLAELARKYGISAEEAERRIDKLAGEKKGWDYPDFFECLGLSRSEALPVLRKWHSENLDVYEDTVRLVRFLTGKNVPVSVISNNPYTGCLLKLERCGLADSASGKSVFSKILSTEIMQGCKGNPGAWENALNALHAGNECKTVMVGDHVREDGILPLSYGIHRVFLLDRLGKKYVAPSGGLVFNNSDAVVEYLNRHPEEYSGIEPVPAF